MCASKVRVPVKSGDVVVLATDGLFDNMPEQEGHTIRMVIVHKVIIRMSIHCCAITLVSLCHCVASSNVAEGLP